MTDKFKTLEEHINAIKELFGLDSCISAYYFTKSEGMGYGSSKNNINNLADAVQYLNQYPEESHYRTISIEIPLEKLMGNK